MNNASLELAAIISLFTWLLNQEKLNNQFITVLTKTNTSNFRSSLFSCWSIYTNMIINFKFRRENFCIIWDFYQTRSTRTQEGRKPAPVPQPHNFKNKGFWPALHPLRDAPTFPACLKPAPYQHRTTPLPSLHGRYQFDKTSELMFPAFRVVKTTK